MPNSRKKCKFCTEFEPANEGIQTLKGWFCSFEHASQWAYNNREKGKKIKHKEQKKKVKLDNISHQTNLTQRVFNRLRVQQELKWFKDRGLEPECISCGKKEMDWCCGHLKTVGAHSELRFDFNNTFLQCNRYCNKGLSGNIYGNKTTRGYLKGLEERFGEEKAKKIIDYCDSYHPPKKYTGEELKSLRSDFSKQLRELKNDSEES